MVSQAPSTLIPSDIDLGGCVLYYAPAPFSSFSAAVSSTKWRKFGLMKEGVQLDITKQIQEFFSGYPAKLQQQYVSAEDLRISGQLLETNPRALARVLGGLTLTETVKVSNPAATTVAAGSSKSVINFTSAAGYAVGDEIRVGDPGRYQYGRIKSINSNAVTLYEDLSDDTAPTEGDAIAKIDTTHFDLGGNALPANFAVKLSHTLVGGYGSYDLYIINCQMTGNLTMNWQDNTQSPDSIGIPFELRAISDAAVESGNTARWIFTQS